MTNNASLVARTLPVSAASLDQRITIQTRITTKDERGQESHTFDAGFTVWAKADPSSGREYVAALTTLQLDNVLFVIRYRPYMPLQFRIMWKNRAYDPIQPPEDIAGGRHTLAMLCAGGKPV